MTAKLDITGQTFVRLTAVERVAGSRWKFRCSCGNEIVRVLSSVKSGNTKSCGCLNRERVIERSTKHGMTPRDGAFHPLYELWKGMKARCSNPNHDRYEDYGGRGIKVCERWLSFQNFVADMGPRPAGTTLDRENPDGDYDPDNCRWATGTEQAENRSDNVYLELDGERLTVSQWSRRLNIPQKTLNRRRYLGWSDSEVIRRSVGG